MAVVILGISHAVALDANAVARKCVVSVRLCVSAVNQTGALAAIFYTAPSSRPVGKP